jgi:hypothetical protein
MGDPGGRHLQKPFLVLPSDVITIDALNLFAKVFFAKLFNPHVETAKELV